MGSRILKGFVWTLSVILVLEQSGAQALAGHLPLNPAPLAAGGGDPASVAAHAPLLVNALSSLQADPFSGAAINAIPLAAPPGRHGLAPSLTLTYNSSGGNGWLGMGWDIAWPRIQRSTKRGLPTYTTADTFVLLDGQQQQELVPIGGGEYHAKIEERFQRYVYDTASDAWTVTTTHGTVMRFGSSAASQQSGPAKTFAWALDRITDLQGNYLEARYVNLGQLVLSEITYTGHQPSGEPPRASITFTLEDRPDPTESYLSGAYAAVPKRLKSVSMRVDGALARRYDFGYTASVQTGRSLLSSLTLIGSDGVTALPPVTFTYQARSGGWSTDQPGWRSPDGDFNATQSGISAYTNADQGRQLQDINGDGLVDWVVARHDPYHGRPSYRATYLNTVTGFSRTADGPVIPGNFFINEWWDDGVRMLDLTGDGRPEVLNAAKPDLTSTSGQVKQSFRHTGTGWAADNAWNLPGNRFFTYDRKVDGGARFGDLNGDGLQDLVIRTERIRKDATSDYMSSYQGSFLNTGSGWSPGALDLPTGNFTVWNGTWVGGAGSGHDGGIRMVDLNGDGLSDMLMAINGTKRAFINAGSYWIWDDRWLLPSGEFTEMWSGFDQGRWLADINGDGLTDICIAYSFDRQTWLNTGSGWRRDDAWNIPDGDFVATGASIDQGRRLADLNGDGMLDLLVAKDDYQRAYLNLASAPDLLMGVDNGLGGSATVTYAPSTTWDNRGADGLPGLPFAVQTVTSLTVSDGMGNAVTTTYRYAGGLYHAASREFRGFSRAWVTDAAGTETETLFHQDDYFYGKSSLQRVKDASGCLFSEQRYTWEQRAVAPGAQFVFLAQQETLTWDGDATVQQTRVRYAYDAYGRPTQVIHDGDVTVGGDEVTTVTTYTANPSLWLLEMPSTVTVQDASGTIKAARWMYYDGSASVGAAPTQGLLTMEERWLNTTDGVTWLPPSPGLTGNPKVRFGYDAYGNAVSATDVNGRTTTTAYDATHHLYPVTVTNALGQQRRATHDPRFGAVLTSTDVNGTTTTMRYDVFGRPTAVIGPNDTDALPTISYAYDLTARPVRTTVNARVQSNQPVVMATYAFVDGLGRTVQTRAPAEDAAQQIVSGAVSYDARGLVKAQGLPVCQPFSTSYVAVNPATSTVTFTYDAVGRVVQAQHPDGSSTSTSYDDWTTTGIDANGHQVRQTADAFGRLVQVEEFTGADGRAAAYPASALAVYATTTYAYDTLGNLVQTRDAQGHVATMTFDSLGRKIAMSDPDMGVWRYRYDAVGNLVEQTDAKNQKIALTYDALNRLKTKTRTGGVTTPTVTYFYDEIGHGSSRGRLTRITDGIGASKFWYDTVGRLTKETKVVNGTTYTIERTYDLLGRLVTLKYPDGELVTYTYNTQGAIERVQGAATYVANVDYNTLGQPTLMVLGNAVTTTYTYHPQTHRLAALLTQHPTTGRLQDLAYTFDPAGNVLGITDGVGTATQAFAYDALDRLTAATGAGYGAQTYAYDAIGNMTSKAGAAQTYGTPKPHAVKSRSDGWSFTYDANGNLATRTQAGQTTTYTYDAENRLTKARRGGTTLATFTYDGDGGRVKQVNAAGTTVYVGQTYEVTGSKKTKYLFLGPHRIAAKDSTGSLLFVHGDHLGSTSVLSDATGTRVRLTEYTPYGSMSRTEGSTDLPHKFTGKRLDDKTDLYFYEARYYDPLIGRFVTADPTIQRPYDPQDLNRYAYARNNPVKYIDPTGLGWKKFWKKVWNAIKAPVIAIATVAAVFFTWGAAAPGITAMGALISQSAGVAMTAAGVTSATLNTGEGRQVIRHIGKEFFDDVLGMSPRTAQIFAGVTAYLAVNMAAQFALASVVAPNQITKVDPYDPAKDKNAAQELKNAKGVNYGGAPSIARGGTLEDATNLLYKGKELVGASYEGLRIGSQPQHIGVILKGVETNSSMAALLQEPFKAVTQGYLTFGISHQATNISLLNADYNTTIMGLGGGWSTLPSTLVYGPYGGGAIGAAAFESTRQK